MWWEKYWTIFYVPQNHKSKCQNREHYNTRTERNCFSIYCMMLEDQLSPQKLPVYPHPLTKSRMWGFFMTWKIIWFLKGTRKIINLKLYIETLSLLIKGQMYFKLKNNLESRIILVLNETTIRDDLPNIILCTPKPHKRYDLHLPEHELK